MARSSEFGSAVTREEEYDYIVLGAGTAGTVVASRLSEDPGVRVALVEAGGPHTDAIYSTPSLWPLQQVTGSDWNYDTEPEPGLKNRRLGLSRGKVLGGSSSMNGMIFLRGAREDYDSWRSLGLPGWGYDDVLPTLRAMESSSHGEDALHGGDGPIAVAETSRPHPIASAWVDAAVAAGHSRNDDFNGASQRGAGYFPLSLTGARRVSSATAYLDPARNRSNLDVLTHTQALRVVIEHGRAVGAEVEHLGVVRTLRARREVIVSGGAYNSPQLLMLSGIGHGDHLRSLGIEVIADLPVGDDLQDHSGVGLYWYSNTPGVDEGSALGEAGGFFTVLDESGPPDTETMVYPFYNGPGNTWDDRLGGSFSVIAQVLRPRSRGTVRLRSPYPSAHPLIRHDHFTDPRDRELIIAAVRLNLEIARQPPLRDIIIGERLLPASESDDDILDHVRTYGHGIWHPMSGCAMGKVVDERLRVLGVEGLRVADASVAPTEVGANPNATVFLIGERAAQFILEDADVAAGSRT